LNRLATGWCESKISTPNSCEIDGIIKQALAAEDAKLYSQSALEPSLLEQRLELLQSRKRWMNSLLLIVSRAEHHNIWDFSARVLATWVATDHHHAETMAGMLIIVGETVSEP
jgi:hypothetical protein